jgi:membrane protein DedA with SNARE-associated domain
MSELDLTQLDLKWAVSYGSPMVAVILLLGALGIPVPGTLLVIASGAFVRQGVLDIYLTPALALSGSVIGDTIIYGLGRFARGWIERRFGQSAGWQKSADFFARRGGLAIYLTRWLITPLAVPTNLIAGSSGYPFWKYLLFDVTGELTWIVLYGGLGYAFGSQWELINQFISDFSGLILGVAMLGAGVFLVFRWKRQPSAPVNAIESESEIAAA